MTTGHSNRTRTLAALTALALAGGGAALLTGTASAAAGGELVYGLTEDNRLVSFRSQTPGTLIANRPLLQNAVGVPLNVDLVGIDVRPRTGELYGLGENSQLYVINPENGVATARGSAITPALQGERFGFDFNPAADRIRIISDAEQNLRVNPDTGGASSVTAPGTNTDGPLRYSDTDRNAGLVPDAVAAAYTNSVDLTPTTAQFAIDAATNNFVQQDSNRGIFTTIGGLNAGDVTDAGLDISPATDTTYALLEVTSGTPATTTRTFATINRSTGAATSVGQVGPAGTATAPAPTVEDVAVAPGRFLVTASSVTEGDTATVTVRREGDVADAQSVNYAITNGTTGSAVEDAVASSGTLSFGVGERSRTFAVTTLDDDFTEGTETLTVALSGATTGAVASNGVLTINDDEAGAATGLTADNRLVDFSVNNPGTATNARPVLNLPSGVTLVGIDTRPRNGELIGVGSNSRIYVINRTTGAATDRGELGVALQGTSFGVDFNPVADRLRIVSDANQNLRVNVDAPGNVAGGAQGTTQDGTLRFNEGDANVGTDPVVVAAAYTNSFNSGPQNTATPTATMQFDIEAATRTLVRQDSNPGTLNTIGALGLADGTTLNVPTAVGLDIAAAGNAAFASFSTSTTAARQLFRVNLATGRATSLGNLATPMALNEGGTTTIEDFTLNATDRATFTPPTASPTASASATPTATASATPTATQTTSPTPTGTATPPPLPVCTSPLTVTTDREFIIPTIAVRVTVTGAAPGAIVDLQAYSRPSDQYRSVRTAAAGTDGTVTFDVTPGTNTRLFAQCVNQAGGSGQGASVSNQRVINVRTALSLTVVRNGTRNYTFQGRILPRRAGQLVTLYRVERDGRRVITSQLKTDASGTYRFTRQFTGTGTFGFLARTGQTLTNAAGESTSAQGQRSEAYLQSGRGTARPTAIF